MKMKNFFRAIDDVATLSRAITSTADALRFGTVQALPKSAIVGLISAMNDCKRDLARALTLAESSVDEIPHEEPSCYEV